MAIGTAFHPRTDPLCVSLHWKDWSGYHAVSRYDHSLEWEYSAFRNRAGLLDVSPLFKCRVRGRDAERLLDRTLTRDVTRCRIGQVLYGPWCDERGIVIMSHSQYEHKTRPYRFARLAERYRNITWVLAHSGNNMDGQIEAVEAAQSAPNIYLETCTSLSEHGTIEFLVDGAGEDRVLYGSDMPILDARHQLGRIVTADISDEAKCKILGLNAIKLLGL